MRQDQNGGYCECEKKRLHGIVWEVAGECVRPFIVVFFKAAVETKKDGERGIWLEDQN